jgi:hypothetical protein
MAHGAPGGRKGHNEQAGEGDEDVASLRGELRVGLVELEVADEGVHQEADHHPRGTSNQGRSAAHLLNDDQTAKGAEHVDTAENDLGDVAVANTGCLEDATEIPRLANAP